jgi:hypothetical protein
VNWKSFVDKATESGGVLKSKTAMRPLLWLNAIVSLPCIGLSGYGMLVTGTVIPALVFMPLVVVVLGFTLWAYWDFKRTDPDRLGSEEFQLKVRVIEFLDSKTKRVAVEKTSLTELTYISGAEADDPKRARGSPGKTEGATGE